MTECGFGVAVLVITIIQCQFERSDFIMEIIEREFTTKDHSMKLIQCEFRIIDCIKEIIEGEFALHVGTEFGSEISLGWPSSRKTTAPNKRVRCSSTCGFFSLIQNHDKVNKDHPPSPDS
jgi:hypothetical protein